MSEQFFQWDYVSLIFEMQPDLFHIYLKHWEDLGERFIGPERWRNGTKVRSLGSVSPDERRYCVSAWGSAARVVQYLPVGWALFVRRLDVKQWDTGLTGAQVDTIAQQLFTSKAAYNVTVINSKPRRKTDDRDAGGKGFAIGSHKSDLRVSSYSRGGAPYCLEFQCKGDMLRRFIGDAITHQKGSADAFAFWGDVRTQIIAVGHARYWRAMESAGIGRYVPADQPEGITELLNNLDLQREPEIAQEELDLDATP